MVNPGAGFILMTMLTLTTGSAFIMWLGEQITERGMGNGMSLLIFAGIVVGLPRGIIDLFDKVQHRRLGRLYRAGDDHADRRDGRGCRLHRVCGALRAPHSGAIRQARGGTQSHGRPIDASAAAGKLRRRDAGDFRVLDSDPAADASAIACANNRYFGDLIRNLGWGEPLYTVLYAVGIIFFAYFYVSIVFNPNEVADNMRKYGGFIPGIRPGKRTADHINEILTRITLVGALVPDHHFVYSGVDDHRHSPEPFVGRRLGTFFERLPTWVTNGLGVNFYFGGTSLLIVVGVAMDTVTQIEAQLVMRHYDGFTPRSGRIRGRRTWS